MAETENKELSRILLDIAWSFGPKGLDDACCDDLTMVEFLALDGISRVVECPVHQVGHSLGFTKSGATKIVNRLVAKGYVSKRMAAHDARVCCLEVTSNGQRILAEAYARYEDILKNLFTDLEAEAVKQMKEALIMFGELLKKENFSEESK